MARLDRAITLFIVLMLMARSSRAMTDGRQRVNVNADWNKPTVFTLLRA